MTEPNKELRDESIESAERSVEPTSEKRRARSKTTIWIAILAVVAIIGVGFVVWKLKPSGNAGRPVPAPPSTSTEQTNQGNTGGPSSEQTLTISSEEAQRAGIKIETVAERLAAETAGQQTTGVVQANA